MRIGFIGAGRVGFTMGKYMKLHGADVAGYYSRTPEHAKEAATFTDTRYFADVKELINLCDAVILTVSDSAISNVFSDLCEKCGQELNGKLLCHTSGATSSRVFENTSYQIYGYSIHPIYAISDRYESYKHFSNAFITIDGDKEKLCEITGLIESVGLHLAVIDSDSKSKYHAASVMASNMVCGLYGAAIRLMTECGFGEDAAAQALAGLFRDNAIGAAENGPVKQLTGPLERNDIATVRGHLGALSSEDAMLYRTAAAEVLKLAKVKNEGRDYSEMERLLKGERV